MKVRLEISTEFARRILPFAFLVETKLHEVVASGPSLRVAEPAIMVASLAKRIP
jgi:hypothetical protein